MQACLIHECIFKISSPIFLGSYWLPLPHLNIYVFSFISFWKLLLGGGLPEGSLCWSPRAGPFEVVLEHLSLSEELLQPDKGRQCQEDSHILYLKILFLSFVLKEVKKQRNKENNPNKKLQSFYFPKGCFLQRNASWSCKHFGGVIQKRSVASAGSSPQIPVLFPEMSVVHIWLCVWVIKTVAGLKAGVHGPSPGSWVRYSSLMLRLLSAFRGTRSHVDLTMTDLRPLADE